MSEPLLVYGATGFTGRLVVDALLARGLRPVVAGRNRERVAQLAGELNLEWRVGHLADAHAARALLEDIKVVLLAAGPFSQTAGPMVQACIEAGVHYLDLTGECDVLDALAALRRPARARGCMVMPGCGFDVVATDCLARHVGRRSPAASHLSIAISGLSTATRGSLRTFAEQAGLAVKVRRRGALATVPPGAVRRHFDYGDGDRWSTAITWGDVVSAFHTTGIPNIDVFFEETVPLVNMLTAGRTFGPLLQTPLAQAWLRAHVDLFPDGPTRTERAVHGCVIVAEARRTDGEMVVSRLKTPEAYSFSATTAAALAALAVDGDIEPGFQTPARVYGADFVMQFAGVVREDVV